MTQSLSQHLAQFVASLTYDGLPPPVVDKLKALTLHGLVVSIAGAATPLGKLAIELVSTEEAREDGATVLVDGARVTRMGAAFANGKLMHATSQSDSYRMLTHPGPCVITSALASAELEGSGGRASSPSRPGDGSWVRGGDPHRQRLHPIDRGAEARGFRSSPVYGVFGAAMATGKLLQLDHAQLTNAIALAATFAGGTGEGPRTEGQESTVHEANAARNGIMAALLAREGMRGAEAALEGEAGFYNAFTGNNRGELSYVFEGPLSTDLDKVVEGLGQRYSLLDVTPPLKIYPTAGYNNPVIELMTQLRARHPIDPDLVEEVTVEMNWLETLYPSPAFPNPRRSDRRVGSTHYFAAYTLVHRHYPAIKRPPGGTEVASEDPRVLDLMERVSVVGQRDRRSFAPRITVSMKSGSHYQGEFEGHEHKWDLETEASRIGEMFDDLPIPRSQLEQLVPAVVNIEELGRIDSLVGLCVEQDISRTPH